MPPDPPNQESSIPPIIASSSNHPLAFVIVSHPTARQDAEVQSQVRRHVAYRWHEDSRRRNMAPRGRPRLLAQKAIEANSSRQSTPGLSQTVVNEAKNDQARSYKAKEETALASLTNVLAFSPSPGSSPVTYLGGGRLDPFNGCAVRCNTMESFLLDHCESCFLLLNTSGLFVFDVLACKAQHICASSPQCPIYFQTLSPSFAFLALSPHQIHSLGPNLILSRFPNIRRQSFSHLHFRRISTTPTSRHPKTMGLIPHHRCWYSRWSVSPCLSDAQRGD